MAVLTQEEYLKRFRTILEHMFMLTSQKNHDYAREEEALANFKEFGSVGVLIRISDKFQRLKNALWFKRKFVVKESIEDTMMDQAVYSVILLILYNFEQEQAEIKAKEDYPLITIPLSPQEARAGAEQIDKNLANYFPKSE